MDFEALRSLEPLLQGQVLVLAAMAPDPGLAPVHPQRVDGLRARAALLAVHARADHQGRQRQPHREARGTRMHSPQRARVCCDRLPARAWAGAGGQHCVVRLCGMRRRWDYIESITGPIMLHTAVAAYRAAGGSGLTILEPGVIYPIDWRLTTGGPSDGEGNEHSVCNPPHPRFNETECKSRFPNAYAVTFWTHTWG